MRAKTVAMWLVLFILGLSTVFFFWPTTALAKGYKWKLNITSPSMDTTAGRAMQAFAKNIKDRTNGQLAIQVFPGGALGYNPFTVHRAVKEGALEMAETCMPYVSEEPVYMVFAQICLFSDAYEANKATDVAWTQLQEAAKKHNQRILMTYSYPNDNLATVSKPMPNLESWKGEKIRAWNPFVAAWLKAVGAVPQVIAFNEKYTALAQHVIEGNFAAPRGMLDSGDYEVTKYYNMWGVTSPIYFVLVNLQQYEALPADIKKVILEEADKTKESLRKELAESVDGDLKILKEKHKMIIVNVPKEEFEKARAAAKSLWEEWAKKAGPEATVVLEKVREALGY